MTRHWPINTGDGQYHTSLCGQPITRATVTFIDERLTCDACRTLVNIERAQQRAREKTEGDVVQ